MSIIKTVRNEWGISQKILAILLDTTRSSVSMMEISGAPSSPNNRKLFELESTLARSGKISRPKTIDPVVDAQIRERERKTSKPIAKWNEQLRVINHQMLTVDENIQRMEQTINFIDDALGTFQLSPGQRADLELEIRLSREKLRGFYSTKLKLIRKIGLTKGNIEGAKETLKGLQVMKRGDIRD